MRIFKVLFAAFYALALGFTTPCARASGIACTLASVFHDLNEQVPYECYQCDTRALQLLTTAKKYGVDLDQASVLWIDRLHGSAIQTAHRMGNPQAWRNHFVVEYKGQIYDFDLSRDPVILPTAEYFRTAFPGSLDTDSDYMVRKIPARSLVGLHDPKPLDFQQLSKGAEGRLGNPDQFPRSRVKDLAAGHTAHVSPQELMTGELNFLSRPISEQVTPGETYTFYDKSTGKKTRAKKVVKIYADGWADIEIASIDGVKLSMIDLKKMDASRTRRGNVLFENFAEFNPEDLIFYHDRLGRRHEGYVLGFSASGDLRVLPKNGHTYIELGEYDLDPWNNMGLIKRGRSPASPGASSGFSSHGETGAARAEQLRTQILTQEKSFSQLSIEDQLRASPNLTLYPKWSMGIGKPLVVHLKEVVGKKAKVFVTQGGKWTEQLINLNQYSPAKSLKGNVPAAFKDWRPGHELFVTRKVSGQSRKVPAQLLHFNFDGSADVLFPGDTEATPVESRDLSPL